MNRAGTFSWPRASGPRAWSTHPALPSPPCAHHDPRVLAVVRVPAVAHLVAVVDPLCLLLLQALAVVDAARAEAVVGVVNLLLLCRDTDQGSSVPQGSPGGGRALTVPQSPQCHLHPKEQHVVVSGRPHITISGPHRHHSQPWMHPAPTTALG